MGQKIRVTQIAAVVQEYDFEESTYPSYVKTAQQAVDWERGRDINNQEELFAEHIVGGGEFGLQTFYEVIEDGEQEDDNAVLTRVLKRIKIQQTLDEVFAEWGYTRKDLEELPEDTIDLDKQVKVMAEDRLQQTTGNERYVGLEKRAEL